MPKGVYIRTKPIWNKGLKGTGFAQYPENIYKGKSETSPVWKGDNVGYDALHDWIKRESGKAVICIMEDITCKGNFEWANISGEYKRDINDFMSLCKSHHRRYDMGRKIQKSIQAKKRGK